VQDNVAPPEKPHSIEFVASGWNVDKWAAPASFVRIRTTEPLWITLFLPTANDGRTTKKVALFDGKEQRIVEVARRKVAKVGPFLPDGGKIDLHVICEYSETGGLNDRRKLGVVLQLEDGEGAKPPVDLKAFEKTFVAPMNHPDAVLVALEFDVAVSTQYLRVSLVFQPSFSPPEIGIIISQWVDHFRGGIPRATGCTKASRTANASLWVTCFWACALWIKGRDRRCVVCDMFQHHYLIGAEKAATG
jgi:hypothetical protein